jgi:hypothetical protein
MRAMRTFLSYDWRDAQIADIVFVESLLLHAFQPSKSRI